MPAKLKKLLSSYKEASFTIHKTTVGYLYAETYAVNGKDIFRLDWYDRLSKPTITYFV